MALSAELLVLSGLCAEEVEARARLEASLASGAAMERFEKMVAHLGGPADLTQRSDRYLAGAPVMREIKAARAGTVIAMDVRAIGLAVVALGGGRLRAADDIDYRVGFGGFVQLGEAVAAGQPLAVVHAATEESAQAAEAALQAAVTIGDRGEPPPEPVRGRVTE